MARRVEPVQDRLRRAALEQAAYQAIFECGFASVTLGDIAAANQAKLAARHPNGYDSRSIRTSDILSRSALE